MLDDMFRSILTTDGLGLAGGVEPLMGGSGWEGEMDE
jgi:hypothetical protein